MNPGEAAVGKLRHGRDRAPPALTSCGTRGRTWLPFPSYGERTVTLWWCRVEVPNRVSPHHTHPLPRLRIRAAEFHGAIKAAGITVWMMEERQG